MMRILYILFLGVCLSLNSVAQEPFLSQYHMAPTFLSPSMAGSTGGSRVVTNFRNQWPGIEQAYKTFTASADMYISPFNSGVGIIASKDLQGSGNLSTLNLSLQYSYRVKLSRTFQFVPGIQFSYGQRKIDLDKLTYATDIIAGTTNGMSYLYFDESSVNYFDFSTSAFLFANDMWIGVNVDHLFRPNTTFLGKEIEIPLKTTIFGAFHVWKERAFAMKFPKWAAFTLRYQQQHNANQLDMGAYLFLSILDIGAWYRGVPIFKDDTDNNRSLEHSAMVLSLGLSKEGFHVGYSFDVPLTKMTFDGRGAHELYMVIEMAEFFGFGDFCLSCLAKRKGIRFNREMPKNMKMY